MTDSQQKVIIDRTDVGPHAFINQSGDSDKAKPNISSLVKIKGDKAKFIRFPWIFWTIGLVLTIIGLTLIFIKAAQLPEKDDFILIMIFGCCISAAGLLHFILPRVEYTCFDRKKGKLIYRRYNLTCFWRMEDYNLSDIKEVIVVKRGVSTFMNTTIHHRVAIIFNTSDIENLNNKNEF